MARSGRAERRRAAGSGRDGAAAAGRRDRALAVVLAVVTVAAYGRIGELGFVNYDDPGYVTGNPHVLGGLSWAGIVWAFTTTAEANWHPLTWLSLMLDATVGGANPVVFHATNLALHVANVLLLHHLLRRTTGRWWESAVVAALFAVHPLRVESVAWVAERKDVLSGFFWLLTTLAWVRHVEAPSPRRHAAALACFALGLMAKPMLVTLPVTLLLLDYWPLRRVREDGAGALVGEKLGFFALAGASAIVTLVVQRPAMAVLEGVSFDVRLANALVSYVAYLGAMLWPVDLAVIYPHPRSGLPAWQPVAAALLLLGLSAVVVHQGGRRPWLPVGWLFYLVTLLPVSGIVQVGYHARADRFTYVPLIGVLVAIVWTLGDGVAGRGAARRPPHLLVALVVAACVALTWRQLGHWRTSVDLFSHVVAVTTDNSRAHYNLGTALEELGDTEGAATHFRETIRIEPGFAEAHFNLTRITMRRGDLDAAAALAREERERWPTHPHTYVDLGAVAALQGRDEEAIRWFEEALRLDPESGDARHNLEVLRARQGLPTSSGVR